MILIVSGVSGSGKTTIGMLLSEALGIPFVDADDFHPESNMEKMKRGVPLSDKDRQPWLKTLAENLVLWEQEGGAVLACSALKESYRAALISGCGESPQWVFLHASKAVLADRLASRKGHFFDPNLLTSQLEALEIPDYGLRIEGDNSPRKIVEEILERLNSQ